VRFATTPEELADADLVVLPGHAATVADLAWLRRRGSTSCWRAAAPRAAGARHLRRLPDARHRREDDVESRGGPSRGWAAAGPDGVRAEKVLGRPTGAYGPHPVTTAYEIHHGVITVDGGSRCRAGGGVPVGAVLGTVWHGALGVRRRPAGAAAEVADAAGRDWRPGGVAFEDVRQARLDALGDLVADHLDTAAGAAPAGGGAPAGLPFVPPGAPDARLPRSNRSATGVSRTVRAR
jgi:adenosylcobyric acid synthase